MVLVSDFLENQNPVKNIKFTDLARDPNLRIMICEFQKILIGFVISKAGKILTLLNSSIQSVPGALDSKSHHLFNGIVKDGEYFINMLDIESILEKLNIEISTRDTIETTQSFKGKKILLAEDSKLFQEKLKKFFNKLEVDLTVAHDGIDGLEKLKKANYDFDIIFTDIEMPNLNGIGMIRQIKKIREDMNIPVIFNTSISNQRLMDDIIAEDLGKYFVKYDEKEILNTLIIILNEAQYPAKAA